MRPIIYLTLLALQLPLSAQILGNFSDPRDGREYQTVSYQIESTDDINSSMTWMAENLNFQTDSSYCYDDFESNCEIMGRLYTWEAAMTACPAGWHLPDNVEWTQLADLFGGLLEAGQHLKSTNDLWYGGNQGTNKSLFNAMPYGNAVIGTGYYAVTSTATFWSAEEIDEEHARDWVLSNLDRLIAYKGQKAVAGNSVRCVKDFR